MSNLATKLDDSWPDAVASSDVTGERRSARTTAPVRNGAACCAFADIYLRNATLYLEGVLQQDEVGAAGELRTSTKGVLTFDKGACEISASRSFLTVAMSAADEDTLSAMQASFEKNLRTVSPSELIEIDWRHA
ncbi:DUF2218 domain-containing protein [Thalassospira sp. MA62]|nr:DUF2218 domain-containing protein [Thalassospira sp. MA62]